MHKEEKWKKRLFTAVIFLVLGSSLIGFTISAIPFQGAGTSGAIKYDGITFTQSEIGLTTMLDGLAVDFTYYPEELSTTQTGNTADVLSKARVSFATSSYNSSMAQQIAGAEFDIARVLERRHKAASETAFIEENPYGKPVITCGQATQLVPVLFFNFTNTTTQTEEKNSCTVINFASEEDLAKIRDKIIYLLIGVNQWKK